MMGQMGTRKKNQYNNQATATPPFFLLAGLLLLGMLIGAHHRQAGRSGHASPAITASRLFVYPFQVATTNIRYAGWGSFGLFSDSARLKAENARLQSENADLQHENQQLQIQLSRLESVAKQVQMLPSEQKKAIHAPIIGWLPDDAETIKLGRGSRDGVHVDSIVRTGQQLLGRVVEVSPLSSHVLLLTDTNSEVHVNVYRKTKAAVTPTPTPVPAAKPSKPITNANKPAPTPAPTPTPSAPAIVPLTSDTMTPIGRGILVGGGRDEKGGGGSLFIKWVGIEQDIQAGDIVMTSGKGRIFPKEAPVGTILTGTIKKDPTASRRMAQVQPFEPIPVDINQVFILPYTNK
jgi:cell shape-determining protein MreC